MITNEQLDAEIKYLEARKEKLLRVESLRRQLFQLEGFNTCTEPNRALLQRVAGEVCAHFRIGIELLNGRSRIQSVVWPRHVFCYIASSLDVPFNQIGTFLGRDHSTAVYARDNVKNRMDVDAAFADQVSTLLAVCRDRLEVAA